MKRKLLCAVAAVAVVAVFLHASAVQEGLAEDLVRFHVIANSDLPFDQELKGEVRDAVVGYVESLTRGVRSRDRAQEILGAHLQDLEAIANAVLQNNGVNYHAIAKQTNAYFPTKSYAGFRLPAGEYQAVTLTLGEGKGRNFWCVLFPPLCLSPVSVQTAASDLSEEEQALLTETDGVTRYRFFLVEAAGKLKHAVSKLLN
ncbi:MAG: stage II sporulation protein R [Oscillospiraceae bacterium]|nr:stage II sporulation protein R [Oscillospiraceae bacterium]